MEVKCLSISDEVRVFLKQMDCSIVGFADLRGLSKEARQNFNFGIVIGILHSREALMENNLERPAQYYSEYIEGNTRLTNLANATADFLVASGYRAWAKNKSAVILDDDLRTVLPHKTVATLAGLGWIGKSAVLVTPETGSGLRISVVLTNASLDCGKPVTMSHCPESCTVCTDICPGHAQRGGLWDNTKDRAEFFDAQACDTASKARANRLLDVDENVCGLCIANCPFTRKALDF